MVWQGNGRSSLSAGSASNYGLARWEISRVRIN